MRRPYHLFESQEYFEVQENQSKSSSSSVVNILEISVYSLKFLEK